MGEDQACLVWRSFEMKEETPASNVEWRAWGDYDPLWGVAAWHGKSKDGPRPWTDSEFFKLGESDWKDFSVHWERYGLDRSSVVEIGCGAGRITLQLAKYFKSVQAIDVSEGMIAYARRHVDAASVSFHLSDGATIPLPANSVTSAFSCHVFQHFDSVIYAARYFNEIARVLQPGGTMMVHLPVYAWPSSIGRVIPLAFRLKNMFKRIETGLKRSLNGRFGLKPIMEMTSYELIDLYATLDACGYRDVEICHFRTRSNDGLHTFIFSRKMDAEVDAQGAQVRR